ncbi:hypothetical protein ACQ4LK_22575, partial [Bacillus pumilus]
MPKVALFNQNGSTNGEIELNASVFGIQPVSKTHLPAHETLSMRSYAV